MSPSPRHPSEHGGIFASLVALVFVVVLCLVVYWARHPIMRYAAESWVVDGPAEHSDAIILLGDDNFYADRATRAAELIRQGAAPVIVASGRRFRPSAGVAELLEHDLLERGVPKEKIIRFAHDSDSTLEEANALAQFSAEHRFRSVIVVTSNYHTRRVRYVFGKVFPPNISVTVASARDGDFDPDRWWERRKSQRLFLGEVFAMPLAAWELHSLAHGEK